jgi:hypothetical protein
MTTTLARRRDRDRLVHDSALPDASLAVEVTVERYAGIVVAVDEGHELATVLAQEQVSPAAWPDIDTSFKNRLTSEADLLETYQAKVAEAEDHLSRRVQPLDEDATAYLAFLRHLALQPQLGAALTAHGLRTADLARLARHWERRFQADEELRTRALALALREPPPDRIRVSPPELRPFPWTAGREAREAAPDAGAPTSLPTLDPALLPSAFRPRSQPVADPPPDERNASLLAAVPLPGPALPYPAASFDRGSALEPVSTLAGTAPVTGPPNLQAVPFRGVRPPPPPVAPTLEPNPELGGTTTLPEGSARPAARPGLEPVVTLAETAPMNPRTQPLPARSAPADPQGGDATPFSGTKQPPPRTPLEPHPALGLTAPVRADAKRPPLPFTGGHDAPEDPEPPRRR